MVENLVIENTLIENYKVKGRKVLVKREDLACPPPGPPFAKVRGLLPYLETLKSSGIKTVGYVDTTVSMAGWGISYFSKKLGLHSIIFEPIYKNGYKDLQEKHREIWKSFGSTVLPIEKPSRMNINVAIAKKKLKEFPNSFMIPQGLKLNTTILEVSKQINPSKCLGGSIIISVGSGTIFSGILKGLVSQHAKPTHLYGILSFPRIPNKVKESIIKRSGCFAWEIVSHSIFILNDGYAYTDKEEIDCPFPCSVYYDRKAWKWLCDHIKDLREPILFWNIGA